MNTVEIAKGITHIEESYRVYCTLITGSAFSILLDTGEGKRDLSACVRQVLGADPIVMNSHGHYDHIGGNASFGSFFISEADKWMLPDALAERARELIAGMEFDLGGETAIAVPLAGHTRGSMGLLLKKSRLVVAGDALNPRLQLLGKEACGLGTLRDTLVRALDMPFDSYLISHAPALIGKRQIEAHLKHLESMDSCPARDAVIAGRPVLMSRFKEGALGSVFIIEPDIYDRD